MDLQQRSLNEFEAGDNVRLFLLCASVEEKQAKNNSTFLAFQLSDRSGRMKAIMFGRKLQHFPWLKAGTVVRVEAFVEEFNQQMQLKVNQLRPLNPEKGEDLQAIDFYPIGQYDPLELYTRLELLLDQRYRACLDEDGDLIEGAERQVLMAVCLRALYENRQALLMAPAAMTVHHAYRGGLLEHMLDLIRLCEFVAAIKGLDTELLLAIAFFHDMGKLFELEWRDGGIEYSKSGRLLGHIVIGYEYFANLQRQCIPFPTERELARIQMVAHGILSHHGSLEHGSPVLPMTKEALAFHHIDMLDSKLAIADAALAGANGDGEFTGYNKYLGSQFLRTTPRDRDVFPPPPAPVTAGTYVMGVDSSDDKDYPF